MFKFNKRIVYFLSILVLLLAFTCENSISFANQENNKEGSLVIIGGALSPDNSEIYNKFIELGGGKDNIKIAIIPVASATPISSSNSYKDDFIRYGVPEDNILIFPLAMVDDEDTEDFDESLWKDNGFNKDIAKKIKGYNAIFFVGGDQLRIVNSLIDSEGKDGALLKEIRKIYENGGVIAGTSAGAAIMSDPMICGGTSLGALIQGVTYEDNYEIEGDNRVFITKGLGFMKNCITDQHFLKRGRLGRLIVSCLNENIDFGFGIDEDTALVVKRNNLEVIGKSGVIIVDVSDAVVEKSSLNNIRLSYIEKGDSFNMLTKKATINALKDTTKGYEYYSGNSLITDIFGNDMIKQALTTDLVDNTSEKSEGIAFDIMKDSSHGYGIKAIFRKGEDTEGYWGKIDGIESYAAINVYMDIIPIEVNINYVTDFENTDEFWLKEYIFGLQKGMK